MVPQSDPISYLARWFLCVSACERAHKPFLLSQQIVSHASFDRVTPAVLYVYVKESFTHARALDIKRFFFPRRENPEDIGVSGTSLIVVSVLWHVAIHHWARRPWQSRDLVSLPWISFLFFCCCRPIIRERKKRDRRACYTFSQKKALCGSRLIRACCGLKQWTDVFEANWEQLVSFFICQENESIVINCTKTLMFFRLTRILNKSFYTCFFMCTGF